MLFPPKVPFPAWFPYQSTRFRETHQLRIVFLGVVNVGEVNHTFLTAIRHEISVSRTKTWAMNGTRVLLAVGAYLGVGLLLTAIAVAFGMLGLGPAAGVGIAAIFGVLAIGAWVGGLFPLVGILSITEWDHSDRDLVPVTDANVKAAIDGLESERELHARKLRSAFNAQSTEVCEAPVEAGASRHLPRYL